MTRYDFIGVTIVPFCVVMVEGHGMAGTYVVVSGPPLSDVRLSGVIA